MEANIGREFFALAVGVSMLGACWFFVRFEDRLNSMRDAVLTGMLEGREISFEHRSLLLSNDWLPYRVGAGIAILTYSCILISIPLLYGLELDLMIVCGLGSTIPLLSACSAMVFGYLEYRVMSDHLRRLNTLRTQTSPT